MSSLLSIWANRENEWLVDKLLPSSGLSWLCGYSLNFPRGLFHGHFRELMAFPVG